ncbi:MAG: trigger factor [Melioribacteraceae bacterium]|nr:trigger factor [Melioribacteraceae bacterium]
MEINVNQPKSDVQEVEVTLSYSEIINDINEAYKKESKSLTIDGFRKGKAPISIIKKLYGQAIEYKASEDIAIKHFWKVVEDQKLKPISTPQLIDLNFIPNEKLNFKVSFEIKPKLELKDYKGIEVKKPIFKFTDEDVNKEIDQMIKPHYQYESVDQVADLNHRITVNLKRLDENGNLIIGQSTDNILIDLSDEKVNPQIKENALNKKLNDTFDFSFVDEHYHGEELHREEYKYQAVITKIEKLIKPELTEELIKKISKNKANNFEELFAFVKKNFEDYYSKQTDDILTNSLLSTVVKNNDFTPPQGYVEDLLKRMVESEIENAKRYKQPQVDEKQLTDYLRPRAEWTAKWMIILENICEIEKIKVEENELEELAKKESEQTGISVNKLLKYYKDTYRSDVLLEDKVINFLKENAKIVEVDAAEELKANEGHNHEH